jgi:proteic killer suppression protein
MDVMIRGFKDAKAQSLFNDEVPKGFPADLVRVTRRKLAYLHAATKLDDLKSPPGNRLEALKADRVGQHSIRINDKYRICFVWTDHGVRDVEVVDYH